MIPSSMTARGLTHRIAPATYNFCDTGGYCELWAEEQAVRLGVSAPATVPSPDAILHHGTNFQCTQWFGYWLISRGSVSPLADYPAACQ
jgi:hypothetical protein